MDFSPIVNEALRMLWWVLPVIVILTVFKTPWFKGLAGETAVKLVARLRLPADTVHSVIVFTGESTFKTAMPDNVRQNSYAG